MSSVRHPALRLPGRLGYVQCKFCTTILLVSVPCSSLQLKMVAVQCGHCAGILSVTVASPPTAAAPSSVELPLQEMVGVDPPPREWSDESSVVDAADQDGSEGEVAETDYVAAVNKPPVRRQRTPSAYNCFIKDEIKRIKAMEPHITHREAFSTAAKNTLTMSKISGCDETDGLTYQESSARETDVSADSLHMQTAKEDIQNLWPCK